MSEDENFSKELINNVSLPFDAFLYLHSNGSKFAYENDELNKNFDNFQYLLNSIDIYDIDDILIRNNQNAFQIYVFNYLGPMSLPYLIFSVIFYIFQMILFFKEKSAKLKEKLEKLFLLGFSPQELERMILQFNFIEFKAYSVEIIIIVLFNLAINYQIFTKIMM
ncbi:MAG: hypothetical protein ACTSYI_12010 [Promethearchaeota archaeon]